MQLDWLRADGRGVFTVIPVLTNSCSESSLAVPVFERMCWGDQQDSCISVNGKHSWFGTSWTRFESWMRPLILTFFLHCRLEENMKFLPI